MKIIVQLQKFNFGTFQRQSGGESHYARIGGLNVLGLAATPAVAWGHDAVRLNREIDAMLPEGVEISKLGLFVELVGEESEVTFSKNGRQFKKIEFKVQKDGARLLTGPSAELQAARFDAGAAVTQASALAAEGRHEDAYRHLSAFASGLAQIPRTADLDVEDSFDPQESSPPDETEEVVTTAVSTETPSSLSEALTLEAPSEASVSIPVTDETSAIVSGSEIAGAPTQVESVVLDSSDKESVVETAHKASESAAEEIADTGSDDSTDILPSQAHVETTLAVEVAPEVSVAPAVSDTLQPVAVTKDVPVVRARTGGFGSPRPVTGAPARVLDAKSVAPADAGGPAIVGRRGGSFEMELPENPEKAAQMAYVAKAAQTVPAPPAAGELATVMPAVAPVVTTVAESRVVPMRPPVSGNRFGAPRPAFGPAPQSVAARRP